MTDLHAELAAWLADGGLGDPPREIAVHASVCEQCTASLGAFDALALIDVGAAGSPPPLAARSRVRLGIAWARMGTAVTATVLAGLIVGFGIAQLVGSGGPASGQPGEPEGTELAGLFAPSDDAAESEAASNDATPGLAPTPAGVPTPLPNPGPQPPPVPGPTPPPIPPPTITPTAPPTATPEPTPLPECNDGVDNDLDGWIDYPADKGCTTPDDDEAPVDLHACNDSIDNDGDGFTDWPTDLGCASPFDDDEFNVFACNDTEDNDGDGFTDWPSDLECTSPFDNDESVL